MPAPAHVVIAMNSSDAGLHQACRAEAPASAKACGAWDRRAQYPLARQERPGTTGYFNMVLVEGVPAPV
jgi:propanediol dehydratase small subunit